MEKIALSLKERQMFIYLLERLKKLNPDEGYDYNLYITALKNGFALHYEDMFELTKEELYKDMFEGLIKEELSVFECSEVWDVLNMYSGILVSYKKLKNTSLTEEEIKFPGFDGNTECLKMAYVEYLINDLERFRLLTSKSYNSHSPMTSKYIAMLMIFSKYKEKQNIMREEQILELLNA